MRWSFFSVGLSQTTLLETTALPSLTIPTPAVSYGVYHHQTYLVPYSLLLVFSHSNAMRVGIFVYFVHCCIFGAISVLSICRCSLYVWWMNEWGTGRWNEWGQRVHRGVCVTDAQVPACLFCGLSQKPLGPLRQEPSSLSQRCNSHTHNPGNWMVSHLSR